MMSELGSDEFLLWNENECEFFVPEELHSLLSDNGGASSSHHQLYSPRVEDEFSDKTIMLSSDTTDQQQQEEIISHGRPLGLRLSKTPSFIQLLSQFTSQNENSHILPTTSATASASAAAAAAAAAAADTTTLGFNPNRPIQINNTTAAAATTATTNFSLFNPNIPIQIDDNLVSQPSEKLKASNFPASFLKIGSWERRSRHEGELVAKCYYAKKKLVWEILEGALKNKIEIQWCNIVAIRATFQADEHGILEIELNQPPSFYRETNPQPRKHTLWQQSADFTGGQAPSCRRHYVTFPPGVLEKHYDKLLQCDSTLLMLSQKPFPSQKYPYFLNYNTATYSRVSKRPFQFNGGFNQFPSSLQRTFPSSSVTSHHVQTFQPTAGLSLGFLNSDSPLSVMDFPPKDEQRRNFAFGNRRMSTSAWGQGANSNVHISRNSHQIQGLPQTFASNVQQSIPNPGFLSQNYQVPMAVDNEIWPHSPDSEMLDVIENHLLSDTNAACSDEKAVLERMRSMSSLIDPEEGLDIANFLVEDEPALSYTNTELSGVNGSELRYKDPIIWQPPQDSGENTTMSLPKSNASYPFVLTEQMVEKFASYKPSKKKVHHWT